jgi:signal transduction histidine kinase/FixJ family two-component response regulator
MAAVFAACVVFAVLRGVAEITTGQVTPWWANALGAVSIGLLRLWVRRSPVERSTVAVHGTALTATVALLVPAAYGMTSSKWWLSLVPFSVLLMGRRKEAIAWTSIALVLLPLTALLEPRLRIAGSVGESSVERSIAALCFLLLLLGITWAFRSVAQDRARALADTAASLERANRVRGRFLAHMSHELRTPLHGVIAMTDLALRGDASPDVREQVATAQQSAKVLLELLNNILDVTRAEADAIELDQRSFSLHETLSEVLRPFEARARAKGVALVATAEPDVVEHRTGDRVRVAQVVINLVSNALKFTPTGEIRVSLSQVARDPARVRVSVSDTGRGIAAPLLARLFEPFSQGDVEPGNDRGAGLGLAIVKELARRMDGKVEVATEVGKGSTFTVELRLPPDVDEPEHGVTDLLAARPSLLPTTPEPATARVLSILVCEDDPTSQRVAALMLKRLGHEVTLCQDGLAAWDLVRERKFDVLLTDIEMPGLDGVELTRHVREREREQGGARLPILAATAHVGEDEYHRLLAAGVDVHVPKPFTLLTLTKALDRATDPLGAARVTPARGVASKEKRPGT